MPVRQRRHLVDIEISRAFDRRKSSELKNRIPEAEQSKRKPDALVPGNAAKTVAQRLAHRIEQHHHDVTGAEPEHRVPSRQTREHERAAALTNQAPVAIEWPVNK